MRWALKVWWLAPHLTALGALTLLSIRLVSNLRFLHRASERAHATSGVSPRVSVLVPARNEAATIHACVSSLIEQTYPDTEVIVLDDDSTDGTGALLDAMRQQSDHLHVLHRSDGLPAGWNGKSFACAVLAEHATGEWLLFTDADTVHKPDSIARGMAYAAALDAALVSAFSYQVVQSWSERLLVSFLLDFLPIVTVDFAALARGQKTRVVANGQYLLVNTARYRALGGHASIRSDLIDDFALARRFHERGDPIALIQGSHMLTCRMYHRTSEVWQGFSKNLLGALDAPRRWRAFLWAPLFAWVYASLFVLPVAHLWKSQQRILALVEIGWLLLLRLTVAKRLKRPPDEVITTPIAAWTVMMLGVSVLFQRWHRAPVVWKGRAYVKDASVR